MNVQKKQGGFQEQPSVSFFVFINAPFHSFVAPVTHKLLEFVNENYYFLQARYMCKIKDI